MSRQITRREFLVGTGAVAGMLPFVNLSSALGAQERPNFVFILTDDQRHDAMSCAGHPFLQTPNLDRFAKEGARFKNAFVTTSLCAPSRACFLTGRYAHSHGITNNGTHLSDDIPTFPQALQKEGYDTAFIGKWHMDGQEGKRPGFNHWVGFPSQGVYFNPVLDIDGTKKEVAGYSTDVLTKFAVDWINKTRNSPFCLYLSYKAVHGPFTPAIRHSKLYSDIKPSLPESANDNLKGKPAMVAKCQESRHGIKGGIPFENFIINYNRTIAGIDSGVGRVLNILENLGILNSTVVIFAGDNGYFQGEHGLYDKRWMYEESIRIPLLIRYPKIIRPGTSIDQMVLNIDVCPTILDLAKSRMPEDVQGKSMRPLLNGKTSGWRSDWLYDYREEKAFVCPRILGMRTERWKYIEYPEIEDGPELYDLLNDPQEMHNAVNESKYAAVLEDMKARLQRLISETGYPNDSK